MRLIDIMENNKDTTAWGGVSAILGLITASTSDLERQFLVIVVFPMLGWLGVYLLKEVVTYLRGLVINWWKSGKTKSNNQ